jgi:SAM-dependent MidA family methyltransferase
MSLEKILTEKIKQSKNSAIGFDEFMGDALYHPEFGYYRNSANKIGKSGDFITAPETSDLFGFCIARQIISLEKPESVENILEFGAGNGVMAAQILLYLAKNNSLPKKYYILELSANLKKWQQENIKKTLPEVFDKVEWINELPNDFSGVILGNEVLDAMPAKRAIIKQNYFYELGVKNKNNGFDWQKLANKLSDKKYNLPDGYISEFNLQNMAWIKSLAQITGSWTALLIDYGFSEDEFFHPDRISGTLRCYKNHKADENPFVDIGKKDITTWVNFSNIAKAATDNNLNVLGYCTQAMFLISLGIEEFLKNEKDESKKIQFASEIKQLVFPNAMGESFKVIVITSDKTLKSTDLICFKEQNLINKL